MQSWERSAHDVGAYVDAAAAPGMRGRCCALADALLDRNCQVSAHNQGAPVRLMVPLAPHLLSLRSLAVRKGQSQDRRRQGPWRAVVRVFPAATAPILRNVFYMESYYYNARRYWGVGSITPFPAPCCATLSWDS